MTSYACSEWGRLSPENVVIPAPVGRPGIVANPETPELTNAS